MSLHYIMQKAIHVAVHFVDLPIMWGPPTLLLYYRAREKMRVL